MTDKLFEFFERFILPPLLVLAIGMILFVVFGFFCLIYAVATGYKSDTQLAYEHCLADGYKDYECMYIQKSNAQPVHSVSPIIIPLPPVRVR